MDEFEKKYGFQEDEKVKAFHRSRRMFCIYKDQLFIAGFNLDYSHAVWFEKQGWISREKDDLMNEIVRGYVDENGDIYFYVGYGFEINSEIEPVFFSYLNELVSRLDLKPSARICGGVIKDKNLGDMPRKEYGIIADYR